MEKQSSLNFFKSLIKAIKQGIYGAKDLRIPTGIMLAEREKALELNSKLIDLIQPIRVRIKQPASIQNNLSKGEKIDDLLGMQVYSKNPVKTVEAIKQHIPNIIEIRKINRPGYVGANIKTTIDGVPVEIQLSPGHRANIGQILQHDSYKPPNTFTEWDITAADKLGKLLIQNGVNSKPLWKQFLS